MKIKNLILGLTMGAMVALVAVDSHAQAAGGDIVRSLDELNRRMETLVQLNTVRSENVITFVQEAQDRIKILESRIIALEPVQQLGPFCPTDSNPCGRCD